MSERSSRGRRTEHRGFPTEAFPRARPRRIEQEAVYQLGKIGNNLNQLTKVANSTGRLGEARLLQEVLEDLLDAVRKLALRLRSPVAPLR